MAEQDKERRGASLIGELLVRLARRAGVPVKVAELDEWAGPAGIDGLLEEFEKALERRHRQARPAYPPQASAPAPPPVAPPRSAAVAPATVAPPPVAAPPPVVSAPPAPAAPPGARSATTVPSAPPEKPAPPPAPSVPQKAKPLPEQPPVAAAPAPPTPPPPAPSEPPAQTPAAPRVTPAETLAPPAVPAAGPLIPAPEKPASPAKPVHQRTTHVIEDESILYYHAIGQIPLDEKAASQPFTMEEKGIEEKQCIFALDRGGVRFYLSTITGRGMNVSKNGVLLLSKQESMRLRGVHYAILNDLRAHGVLLPFAFGTVSIGREGLLARIDDTMYDLRDALEEILSTKWWNLGVYALDQKMAQAVGADAGSSALREREKRVQGTRMPVAGRLDIKTLERLLGKQKKVAESIHDELKEFAVRSDVDLIVGLTSGSSEDWKPILRASYEVPLSAVEQFNRAVIDLQYRHFQYDLMFVLNGDREEFSFS